MGALARRTCRWDAGGVQLAAPAWQWLGKMPGRWGAALTAHSFPGIYGSASQVAQAGA